MTRARKPSVECDRSPWFVALGPPHAPGTAGEQGNRAVLRGSWLWVVVDSHAPGALVGDRANIVASSAVTDMESGCLSRQDPGCPTMFAVSFAVDSERNTCRTMLPKLVGSLPTLWLHPATEYMYIL